MAALGLGASATAGGLGISAAVVERAVKSVQTERIDALVEELKEMVKEANAKIPELEKMLHIEKKTKDPIMKNLIAKAKDKFTNVMKNPSTLEIAEVAEVAEELFENPWVENALHSNDAYSAFNDCRDALAKFDKEFGGTENMVDAASNVITDAADSLLVEAGGSAVDAAGNMAEAAGIGQRLLA